MTEQKNWQRAVSYTHLDVYKRQVLSYVEKNGILTYKNGSAWLRYTDGVNKGQKIVQPVDPEKYAQIMELSLIHIWYSPWKRTKSRKKSPCPEELQRKPPKPLQKRKRQPKKKKKDSAKKKHLCL